MVAKKLRTGIDGQGKKLMNNKAVMSKIRNVAVQMQQGEVKGLAALNDQYAEDQQGQQRTILRELWKFYVSKKEKKEGEEQNELLNKDKCTEILLDFGKGYIECVNELQKEIFEAVWMPLVPVSLAMGVSMKDIRKKEDRVWAYIQRKGQEVEKKLASITPKDSEIQELVEGLEGKEIGQEAFVKAVVGSKLAKNLLPISVVALLTPAIKAEVDYKLFDAQDKDKA